MAAEDTPSSFQVTRGRSREHVVSIDIVSGAIAGALPAPLAELDQIGFSVVNPDPEQDYRVLLGDVPVLNPTLGADDRDPEIGRVWGMRVEWETRSHFESCRGRTPVRLECRTAGTERPWSRVCEIEIAVVPLKISEARYEAMFAQLAALASQLVFDVVSKSRRAIGNSAGSRVRLRPSLGAEVELLEDWWSKIEDAIRQIEVSPARSTVRVASRRQCWGNERLTTRSLRKIASRTGVGVGTLVLPFAGETLVAVEFPRAWEHRVILGILNQFDERLTDCQQAIDEDIGFLEAERPFRDVRPASSSLSLYQTQDLPRLQRLRRLSTSLRQIRSAIGDARAKPVFAGLQALRHHPDSPVFLNQPPYRQIRTIYFRMQSMADRLTRFGVDERVKDTSKMYEHWVYIQLAIALRIAGLECTDVSTIVLPKLRRRGLRIDRRTQLTFIAGDGRRVVLKYEPWVSNATEAKARGDSLYRADNRPTALCPDIVLEVLDPSEGSRVHRVSYVAVIDAKYKASVRDEELDSVIGKYTSLRACVDDSQVVRQVWVVAPLTTEGIFPRESSVQWSPNGPSRPRTEHVHGRIGALPPDHVHYGTHDLVQDWVAPPIQRFADGLLRYLNLLA